MALSFSVSPNSIPQTSFLKMRSGLKNSNSTHFNNRNILSSAFANTPNHSSQSKMALSLAVSPKSIPQTSFLKMRTGLKTLNSTHFKYHNMVSSALANSSHGSDHEPRDVKSKEPKVESVTVKIPIWFFSVDIKSSKDVIYDWPMIVLFAGRLVWQVFGVQMKEKLMPAIQVVKNFFGVLMKEKLIPAILAVKNFFGM